MNQLRQIPFNKCFRFIEVIFSCLLLKYKKYYFNIYLYYYVGAKHGTQIYWLRSYVQTLTTNDQIWKIESVIIKK